MGTMKILRVILGRGINSNRLLNSNAVQVGHQRRLFAFAPASAASNIQSTNNNNNNNNNNNRNKNRDGYYSSGKNKRIGAGGGWAGGAGGSSRIIERVPIQSVMDQIKSGTHPSDIYPLIKRIDKDASQEQFEQLLSMLVDGIGEDRRPQIQKSRLIMEVYRIMRETFGTPDVSYASSVSPVADQKADSSRVVVASRKNGKGLVAPFIFFKVLGTAAFLRRADQLKEMLMKDLPENSLQKSDLLQIATALNEAEERQWGFEWMRDHAPRFSSDTSGSVLFDPYLVLCEFHLRSMAHVELSADMKHQMFKWIDLDYINQLRADAETTSSETGESDDRKLLFPRYERLAGVYAYANEMEKSLECVQRAVDISGWNPTATLYRYLIGGASLHGNDDLVLNCYEECKKFYRGNLSRLRQSTLDVMRALERAGKPEEIPQLAMEFLNMDFGRIPTSPRDAGDSSPQDSRDSPRDSGVKREEPNHRVVRQKSNFFATAGPQVIEILTRVVEQGGKASEEAQTALDHYKTIVADAQEFMRQFKDNPTVNLTRAVKANDYPAIKQLLPQMLDRKLTPNFILTVPNATQIVNLLRSHNEVTLLKQILQYQTINGTRPPLFITCKSLMDTQIQLKQYGDAMETYTKMTRDYGYYLMPIEIGDFLRQVRDRVKGEHLDLVLQDAEAQISKRRQNSDRPGYVSNVISYYATAMLHYAKERQFGKTVALFERVADPGNSLTPVLNPIVFNNILMGLMREWNVKDFMELYGRLEDNSRNSAVPERSGYDGERQHREGGSRDAWAEQSKFYRELVAQQPGEKSRLHLHPPARIQATRVSNNLKLTFLIQNAAQPEQVIEAFVESLDPDLKLLPPSKVTYSLLSNAIMRISAGEKAAAAGDLTQPWHDKDLKFAIGEECVQQMANIHLSPENSQEVLDTVREITMKHLASYDSSSKSASSSTQSAAKEQ